MVEESYFYALSRGLVNQWSSLVGGLNPYLAIFDSKDVQALDLESCKGTEILG